MSPMGDIGPSRSLRATVSVPNRLNRTHGSGCGMVGVAVGPGNTG